MLTAGAWGATLATIAYALGGALREALADWRWTRRQLRCMECQRRRMTP